jgi:hypothetical protein
MILSVHRSVALWSALLLRRAGDGEIVFLAELIVLMLAVACSARRCRALASD